MQEPEEPFALALRAADALRLRFAGPPDVAIVMGSGWAAAEAELGPQLGEMPATDLPGAAAPSAPGHRGVLRVFQVGERRVVVSSGRLHLFEGHPPAAVAHMVRALVLAGATTVVLTNAAGALRRDLAIGRPVVLRDQLNLTARSPLAGPPPPAPLPGRFVDVSTLYDPGLRRLARTVDPSLGEAVYAGVLGPQFETPAEVAMLARLGADVVGMSTVLEAIAAHHLGARVLGLSLVTNPAGGEPGRPVGGDEVLRVADRAAPAIGRLLAAVIRRLGEAPRDPRPSPSAAPPAPAAPPPASPGDPPRS